MNYNIFMVSLSFHRERQMKINKNKKLYSVFETYRITVQALHTMPQMQRAKKKGDLDDSFIERIMLAVTEVNGCAICSYAHTKIALEAGLTDIEIKNMLSGISADVPEYEIPAVLFSQHYADTRGSPSKDAWQRVVEIYGLSAAKGILGAIRAIMMGNAYGIAWSSFFNRLRGKPDPRSGFLYEISMIIFGLLFIPFAIIHALLLHLFKVSLIHF